MRKTPAVALPYALAILLAAAGLSAVLAAPRTKTPTGTRGARPGGTKPETEESAAGRDAQLKPVLDATTSATPLFQPVVFATHDQHARRLNGNCRECHHDLDDNQELPRGCSACHGEPGAKQDLEAALHAQCRGCHLRHRQENLQSLAPTTCLGCHRERK